jgi:hypothetical protein
MADEQNKPIRRVAVARLTEDALTPPPPGFISPFQKIDEWLTAICAGEQPQRAIAEYNIAFFDTPNDYFLGLAGYNTYYERAGEIRRIEFRPSAVFMALSKSAYKNIAIEHVRERIVQAIVAWTKTAPFKDSFLAKGSCITMDLYGEIWANYVGE